MSMPSIANLEPGRDAKRCPVCHSSMNRIPRRLVDFALCLFKPIQRYRCRSITCGWEGNL
ncbi:MAG: hypothetical protein H6R14_246 [Proteobacteria bacterium]|nr:hypothetical protein [Pseudomonadota bacterium]